jgi:CheY-like chemotaxis protein
VKTILLLEDNLSTQTRIRLILEHQGYRVVCDGDGRKAMKLIEQEGIDLVLTDIHLPDCDGLEVVQAVRPAYPDLPIIAISGGDATGYSYLDLAEAFGANAILNKPVDGEALLQRVGALLPG